MTAERGHILFVTGTDTGVGKTVVSSLLLRALLNRGFQVGVMKPVETGCREEGHVLIPADGALLWNATGRRGDLREVAPYRYRAAVGPTAASVIEGWQVPVAELHRKIERASKEVELLIVEGAGGLLVPISGDYSFADLAAECGMHVLVVVGSRLGVLNHGALTFEVLKGRNLPVVGYVLNEFHLNEAAEGEHTAEQSNRDQFQGVAARYLVSELAYQPFLHGGVSLQNLDQHSGRSAATQCAEAVIEYFGIKSYE